MNVKSDAPKLDILRQILVEQNGILRTADLVRLDIARTYLTLLEKSGEIERIGRGIYQKAGALEDEFVIIQSRYRRSIFSHVTALYLLNLTDRTPLVFSLTVPSRYHSASLDQSGMQVYYVRQQVFDLGVATLRTPHGNPVRATGLERTIIDIVRNRNQIDLQILNDALKRYVKRKEKDLNLLYRYAEQFRVANVLRQTIEILL